MAAGSIIIIIIISMCIDNSIVSISIISCVIISRIIIIIIIAINISSILSCSRARMRPWTYSSIMCSRVHASTNACAHCMALHDIDDITSHHTFTRDDIYIASIAIARAVKGRSHKHLA